MNWDIELQLLDGALGGTVVGSLYELGEAYFLLPREIEPPADFMTEIALVSVAGAVLWVIVSAFMKRLKPEA